MMHDVASNDEAVIPAIGDRQEEGTNEGTVASKKTMRKRRKKMFVQIREQVRSGTFCGAADCLVS